MGRPPKNVPKQQVLVRYAFQRELLGNLTFDAEKDNYLSSRYLLRNINRVLRFHKRRLARAEAYKLKAVGIGSGSRFSQSTGPSISFGGGSSHASFPDARKAVAAQNGDREFPAFSEYIEDRSVTLYIQPFEPKRELFLGQSELHLDIVRLRATPRSNTWSSYKSNNSHVTRCTISAKLFDRKAARLDLVSEQSRECILMRDPSSNDSKVILKQPFKFGSEVSPGKRYHMEVRLTPAVASTARWSPGPVTILKTPSSLIGEPGRRIFRDGLHASYTDFLSTHKTRERARILYAADGTVYKTAYDLEISIAWAAAAPQSLEKPNPHRFGPGLPEETDVITSYTIASAQDQQLPTEVRRVKFTRYHCPLCLRPLAQTEFKDIVTLRFHFATAHPAHKLALQQTKTSTRRKNRVTYSFLVSAASQKEKFATPWMTWVAPSTAFDVAAYVNGDESWLGSKSISGSKGLAAVVEDPVRTLRRENNGFLPAQHIQDIPARVRRKYLVPITKTRIPMTLFTSITHRPLQPDEELSESDDETDETWLRDKQAQEIMDESHKSILPLELWNLAIRWNDHKKSERAPSAFHCSDTFFRWVKKDKEWLGSKTERFDLFQVFSERLWRKGVISEGMLKKCMVMVCLAARPKKSETTTMTEENGT